MKGVIAGIIFVLVVRIGISQPFQCLVKFRDKENSSFVLTKPAEFLSFRSIQRRLNQGIKITESDLPISPDYLNELAKFPNVRLLARSKWFNDVLLEMKDTSVLGKLRQKEFVASITLLPSNQEKQNLSYQKNLEVEISNATNNYQESIYGAGYHQIWMLKGDYLHLSGYRGEGMLIGIIDAGFTGLDKSNFFLELRFQDRIISTRDFVDQDDQVYAHSTHGTYVMSTLASNLPGTMTGTAPAASFLLLRSEDSETEYLAEEYFWVAAAEFADSAGVQVINSSLGYTRFDDSLQNHTYADLDGKTTRVTRGADMAASKGILLCISAGNSGAVQWQKIGAPADGTDILAVGAVDSSLNIASFSSRGPSADGRIKPDIVAQGKDVIIGRNDGTVGKSNGTSFASPIIAGVAACLWQANPAKNAIEIKNAIIESANRFAQPDTNYGNGLPDFMKADRILKGRTISKVSENELLGVFPNPFTDYLIVTLYAAATVEARFKIYELSGKLVSETTYSLEGRRESFICFDSRFLPVNPGAYILKIGMGSQQMESKIFR